MSGKASSVAPLACILVVFALWTAWGWSPDDFGYLHDDALYLTAGRSIADGNGYRFPSLPVAVGKTKYPIGYPFLLSLVWRTGQGYPDILSWVFALHIALGCCFLCTAYVVFRQLDWGKWGALGLTAVCAVHPGLADVTRMILSDLPFMAFALGSMALAERALRDGETRVWTSRWWALATALAVAAVLTRSIGVAVVAGVFVVAARRRALRPAAVYAAVCAAVFLLARLGGTDPITSETQYPGFQQTMLFYTDYIGFWRFAVPDWETLAAQIEFNGLQLLKTPAYLCFYLPVLGFSGGMWQAVAIALSVGIVRGAFRGERLHPLGGAFAFHLPVVLLWNYALADRFLLLFVPFFYHGAGREIATMLAPAREAFRAGGDKSQRVAAGVLCTSVLSMVGYGAYRCLWAMPRADQSFSAARAELSVEKQSAYEWVRHNTAPNDAFVAYEDVVLYLETGRQGLRPIAPTSASFYLQNLEALQPDLDRLGDTAHAIKARYWLVASDDYHLEHADTYLRESTESLLGDAPVVFVSPGGKVRVHDLSRGLHEAVR